MQLRMHGCTDAMPPTAAPHRTLHTLQCNLLHRCNTLCTRQVTLQQHVGHKVSRRATAQSVCAAAPPGAVCSTSLRPAETSCLLLEEWAAAPVFTPRSTPYAGCWSCNHCTYLSISVRATWLHAAQIASTARRGPCNEHKAVTARMQGV
jgi:hypothetical protein